MSTQVGGNEVHTLSKEAQLVKPLRNIATKAMHEDESLCGSLRMDIDHADAPEILGTTSSRHIDVAAVELDIECHKGTSFKGTFPLFFNLPPAAVKANRRVKFYAAIK